MFPSSYCNSGISSSSPWYKAHVVDRGLDSAMHGVTPSWYDGPSKHASMMRQVVVMYCSSPLGSGPKHVLVTP